MEALQITVSPLQYKTTGLLEDLLPILPPPDLLDGGGVGSLCFSEEDLALLGDLKLNFTINTNCSGNGQSVRDIWQDQGTGIQPKMNQVEMMVLLSIYVILAITALTMNIFILVVIIKNSLHRKPTYIFITVLALSDVLMLTFNMPLGLYYTTHMDWIFGPALCHIAYPTFTLPVYVSSWTIMLISLDRCLAARPVSNSGLSRKQAIMLVAAVVLVSILLAIPLMMYTKYEKLQDRLPDFIKDDRALCIEEWPLSSSNIRVMYGTIIMATQFKLPVIVTIILHAKIYHTLQERFKKTRRYSNKDFMLRTGITGGAAEARAKKTYERKKAVGKTLIAIVIVFVICWSPVNIFMIIMDVAPASIPIERLSMIDAALRLVAISSSCINPIFYGWLNKAFREDAIALIKRCGGPKCLQQSLKRRLSTQIDTSHASPEEKSHKKSTSRVNLSVNTIVYNTQNITNRMENDKQLDVNSNLKVTSTRNIGQSCPKDIQQPRITGSTNKLGEHEMETLLINEDKREYECSCCPSDNAKMVDYRCWDTQSLGEFLTPEVSAISESDEELQSNKLMLDHRTPMKIRSVTFLDEDRHHPHLENNTITAPLPLTLHSKVPSKRGIFGRRKSKKHPTINYSIIFANNLLQNIVVNTCESDIQLNNCPV